MNQSGINELTMNQDSTSVNSQSVTPQVSIQNQVKIDASKSILAIPETPKRFQTKKVKAKTKQVLFTPSSKDSIEFNLQTKVNNQQGIINNSVVRDFLEPISRNDLLWIEGTSKSVTADYKVAEKEISTPAIDSIQIANVDSVKEKVIVVQDDRFAANKDSAENILNKSLLETQQTIEVSPKSGGAQGNLYAKDFLTGLLILSVAITGIIRLTNFKYLREIFSAVVFGQYARKMQKTDSMRNQKAAFSLNGLFLFNTALFIYEYVHFNNIDTPLSNSLLLVPITMGGLLAFGVVKLLLYRFVAYVFECTQQTNDYIFFSSLYDKIFGLIILPVALIIPYIDPEAVPMLFNLGIGIFVLLYLIQLFRGFVIILKNVASLFYMFLYLCALEILPLVIMYNILIK